MNFDKFLIIICLVFLICIFIAQIVHFYIERERIRDKDNIKLRIDNLKNKNISTFNYWRKIQRILTLKVGLNNTLVKLSSIKDYHNEKELFYMRKILEKQVTFNNLVVNILSTFFIAFFTIGCTLMFNLTNSITNEVNEYKSSIQDYYKDKYNIEINKLDSEELEIKGKEYLDRLQKNSSLNYNLIFDLFDINLYWILIIVLIFLLLIYLFNKRTSKIKTYLTWVEYLEELKRSKII